MRPIVDVAGVGVDGAGKGAGADFGAQATVINNSIAIAIDNLFIFPPYAENDTTL